MGAADLTVREVMEYLEKQKEIFGSRTMELFSDGSGSIKDHREKDVADFCNLNDLVNLINKGLSLKFNLQVPNCKNIEEFRQKIQVISSSPETFKKYVTL